MGELRVLMPQRSETQRSPLLRSALPQVPETVHGPARRGDRAATLEAGPAVRALQPQLLVGPVDDPFEQEAERTADRVTGGTDPVRDLFGDRPLAASLTPLAQRATGKQELPAKKDDDEEAPVAQRAAATQEPPAKKDEDEKAPVAQRATATQEPPEKKDDDEPKPTVQKQAAGAGPDQAPPEVEASIRSMRGGGDPLPAPLRARFEPRFGFDLGAVRTHGDGRAARAATALRARAFTVGDHIFFGAGEFQPAGAAGQRLLAHELTHTIQQKPAASRSAGLLAAPVRAQRLFDDTIDNVLETVRTFATRDFPPWELLTVLLGRDPITDKEVERSARNWLHAVLKLVPHGMEIFDDLEKNKTIEKVTAWFDAEIAKLDLTWDKVKALFRRAWDALDFTDIFSPGDAWEKVKAIFAPTIERIWDFIKAVGAKIVDFIKTTVLEKIGAWAKEQRGYTLLTFVLGKDPVTDQPVERTATLLVKAVLDLVPGGDQIFANLEKTKAIERAVAWLEVEIAKLDLSAEKIRELFARAWDAFEVTDLLHPVALIEKMADIFLPPVTRLLKFVVAVGKKVLEFVFEGAMMLAGPMGMRIAGIFRRIGDTFNRIVADPIGFVGNLVKAVKAGFELFGKNIWEHLKTGLIGWLVGALEGAGLVLPTVWDLKGILSLALQVLGISYAKVREKLVKVLGEKTVSMLETAFEFLRVLVTEGPAAAWEKIVEAIGSLWDMVLGGIQDWAVSKIVTAAVTKLATMFNPAGAIIQAIIAIYNTIAFFVERIKQIVDLVEAIVESIANIAAGKLGQAAAFVERAMARTIPVILGFLARLIGLGDVSEAIKKVITTIQAKVDKAIDAVIAWIVEKAKALYGAAKEAVGKLIAWWEASEKFTTEDGEAHELTFEGSESSADLVVRSSPQRMAAYFTSWQSDVDSTEDESAKKSQQRALDNARTASDAVAKLQKELPRKPTGDADDAKRQAQLKTLNTLLETLASHLAKRSGGGTPPLPPPILPAFADGVRATGFEAAYISKKTPYGTESGQHRGKLAGWDYIQSRQLGHGSKWVKMHLLPAPLGGLAVDSNLVPARGPDTNLRFARSVEWPAAKALKETEQMIWYDVKVRLRSSPDEQLDGSPSSIAVEWGGYKETNGKWTRKKPSGADSQTTDPPPLVDEEVIQINRVGAGQIRAVAKVSQGFATRVWALARERNFVNGADLEIRLLQHETAKGGRNPFADFSSDFAALQEAVSAGKIGFKRSD